MNFRAITAPSLFGNIILAFIIRSTLKRGKKCEENECMAKDNKKKILCALWRVLLISCHLIYHYVNELHLFSVQHVLHITLQTFEHAHVHIF